MTLKDWCEQNNRMDIMLEWNDELNVDIDPSTIAVSSRKKVWWTCEHGHIYHAVINDRTKRNTHCPVCMGRRVVVGFNDLKTFYPEIASQWHPTKNGNLKPIDVTRKSNRRVWWRCSEGHEWEATVDSRVRGNKCPYCSNKKVLIGFNDLATTHPHIAKQWHPTKNGKLKPTSITAGSNHKVWWKCDIGHEWQAVISSRTLSRRGCPVCSKGKQTSFPENAIYFYIKQIYVDAIKSYKSDWLGPMEIDIFIPSLNIGIEYDGGRWHNDVENDLCKNKLCQEHNISLIRIREPLCPIIDCKCIKMRSRKTSEIERVINILLNNHLNCDRQLNININKDITAIRDMIHHQIRRTSFLSINPIVAEEWHPTKNGNLKPEHVKPHSNQKVWWQCENGHEWMDTCHHRMRGHGCPYCSNQRVLVGYNDLATTSPELVSQLHPTKNGDLKPTDIVAGSQKKIWWLCQQCGYEWQTTPASRRIRQWSCPKCARLEVGKERRLNIAKQRLGERQKMHCGKVATIIGYNSYDDIDIQFEDGTTVKHRNYSDFKNGNIKYPIDYLKQRLGQTGRMNCGLNATIIKYRTSRDIDVQFEDGTIIKNREYSAFKKGTIRPH